MPQDASHKGATTARRSSVTDLLQHNDDDQVTIFDVKQTRSCRHIPELKKAPEALQVSGVGPCLRLRLL